MTLVINDSIQTYVVISEGCRAFVVFGAPAGAPLSLLQPAATLLLASLRRHTVTTAAAIATATTTTTTSTTTTIRQGPKSSGVKLLAASALVH